MHGRGLLLQPVRWFTNLNSGSNSCTLKPYLLRRAELSVQFGCLLCGRRMMIQPSLHKPVMQQLHSGHSGTVRMKEMARSYVWWPSMDNQIKEIAKNCSPCQRVRNNPQIAPLYPLSFPQESWYHALIDFSGPVEDKMLLVAGEGNSKWPEVAIMRSTTTKKTVEMLGEIFSCFGSPIELVSDNELCHRKWLNSCRQVHTAHKIRTISPCN